MPTKKTLLALLLGFLMAGSCEEIDCTLNNVVQCHFTLYDTATGSALSSFSDTLTVTAAGTDSVLYNRGVGVSTLSLPLSYYRDADTLFFIIDTPDETYVSTLVIAKTNTAHYENPDCPATMFHVITSASVLGGVGVDSVSVSREDVNYLQDENIKVYIRTDLE